MAVLYRSHFHALELQLELTRRNIPFDISSGIRFFEQAHVKDVCSLLRILCTPGDLLGFQRLMGLLPRVGEKTALKIWKTLGGRFDASSLAARKAMMTALPAGARPAWARIEPLLDAYTAENLQEKPGEVLVRFVDKFYTQFAADNFDNHTHRLEDLGELAIFASRFNSGQSFLNEVALLTNVDAEHAEARAANEEAVRLSTIHQAKGLEWKVVFILWLAEGMFPSSRSLGEAGNEQEERRLFYVATTRAKDELYLCYPTSRRGRDGSVAYFPPSRFIKEIPRELVQIAGW
jgi:DNA helicase-2/ATP-dependent DNA helicase PcrA